MPAYELSMLLHDAFVFIIIIMKVNHDFYIIRQERRMSFKYSATQRAIIGGLACDMGEKLAKLVYEINMERINKGAEFVYQLKMAKQGGFQLLVKTKEEIWDFEAKKFHPWAFDSFSNIQSQIPTTDGNYGWEMFDYSYLPIKPSAEEEARLAKMAQDNERAKRLTAEKEAKDAKKELKRRDEEAKLANDANQIKAKVVKLEKEPSKAAKPTNLSAPNAEAKPTAKVQPSKEAKPAVDVKKLANEDLLDIPAFLDRKVKGSAN